MSLHRPDVVVHRDTSGRWHARCLTCGEAARPTSHRPLIEQWRKDHNTRAVRSKP